MPQILFRNANLLDTQAGRTLPGHSVLVEDERIVELREGEIRAPDAQAIDVGGRTLMPGLIDAHVHAAITTMNLAAMAQRPLTLVAIEAAKILEGMLRRGFTSVRDAGGADRGMAQAVERGLIAAPRLFYSGRALSQTGGHGDFGPLEDAPALCACAIRSSGLSHVADGVSAVRKAAREELRRGAHQIKIMASGGVASPSDPIWNLQYSGEEMRAIVEEAQSWRTYALAHAYTPEAISRAVEAGVRSIEHGNLLDTATAARMHEAGAYLVPTLVTYFAIDELGRALGCPAASVAKVKDVLDAGLASLETAKAAGVPMGFGTDLLGETHEQQSREFSIRAQVLSQAEILRSATVVNAEILNRSGELGVISPGALADLLVVDGDPLENLSLLEKQGKHLPVIMKGGQLFVNRLS
ncbi:MAG: amidohydrolase family protein [Deltaproteobacteria bacterium]|nr:amidohydrolase family protein [Deltaproteobacteria bacterium]